METGALFKLYSFGLKGQGWAGNVWEQVHQVPLLSVYGVLAFFFVLLCVY